MRLTVISHSCVLPANQTLWAAVAARPDLDLRLIVPRRWRSSLHGPLAFEPLPELAAAARPLGVHRAGQLHLHTYSDLGPALTDGLPDVLYLDEDPHSLVAWQVLGLQRLMEFRLLITLKQNLPRRYPPPFSWIERSSYRHAAAAAATSAECLQAARHKGYLGPAEIVHYPVDVRLFSPALSRPPGPRLRLGYAGRLVPEKGVADLLHAVSALQPDLALTLSLVGAGPQRPALEALAARILPSASIEFRGPLPPGQMPDWYRSLDLLVLPSHTTPRWQEQFGRVAAEAMACGVPVVGSDSGFIPQLLHSVGGGLIYQEGNVEALVQTLRQLADDPAQRQELARQAREGVVKLYSVEAIATRTVALVRRAAATPA